MTNFQAWRNGFFEGTVWAGRGWRGRNHVLALSRCPFIKLTNHGEEQNPPAAPRRLLRGRAHAAVVSIHCKAAGPLCAHPAGCKPKGAGRDARCGEGCGSHAPHVVLPSPGGGGCGYHAPHMMLLSFPESMPQRAVAFAFFCTLMMRAARDHTRGSGQAMSSPCLPIFVYRLCGYA